MMRTKILILGLISLCLFSCKKDFKNPYAPIIPQQITTTVIMDGLPTWVNDDYIFGSEGLCFGMRGSVKWGGVLKNVGPETAYLVMLKVILYDPDGNYLTEKYAEFFEEVLVPGIYPERYGTSVDILQNEHATWLCWWEKDKDMELYERFNPTGNPYRPDLHPDPAKCFVITWTNCAINR